MSESLYTAVRDFLFFFFNFGKKSSKVLIEAHVCGTTIFLFYSTVDIYSKLASQRISFFNFAKRFCETDGTQCEDDCLFSQQTDFVDFIFTTVITTSNAVGVVV